MLNAMLICTVMVLLTVTIHYEGLQLISKILARWNLGGRRAIVLAILSLFALHTVEVWLYAAAYLVASALPPGGGFGGEFAGHWNDYLYFSAVSYTSLGLGDVYPQGGMRLIAGVEALNGLMLIAWSASFSYLMMERLWGFPNNKTLDAEE